MKPVNSRIRAKSGKIGHRGIRRTGKSGTDDFSKKAPCKTHLVSKTTTKETPSDISEIPGVEQLEAAPDGSVRYVPGDFYSDEAELIVKRATRALDRSKIFIAPRVGWPKGIYRKPTEAKS